MQGSGCPHGRWRLDRQHLLGRWNPWVPLPDAHAGLNSLGLPSKGVDAAVRNIAAFRRAHAAPAGAEFDLVGTPARLLEPALPDLVAGLERGPQAILPRDLAWIAWTLGLEPGDMVRLTSADGQVEVEVKAARAGELPSGLLFISYGDISSRLMGGETHGSGMPTSKGLDVELELLDAK